MHWIPLESNPEVLNGFAGKLGVKNIPSEYSFCDIFGLDDELLAMVPAPALAVLLLFPITPETEQLRKEEEAQLKASGAPPAPPSVFHMKQTIGNACGTIGLLHCVANAGHAIWKAGGTYLPLDPAFPEDRLAIYIADSGTSALLTSHDLEGLASTLLAASGSSAKLVYVTDDLRGDTRGNLVKSSTTTRLMKTMLSRRGQTYRNGAESAALRGALTRGITFSALEIGKETSLEQLRKQGLSKEKMSRRTLGVIADNLDLRIDPKQPAYVIFTSGSTGRPKGVLVPHVALSDILGHSKRIYNYGTEDVYFLTMTISFDPHVAVLMFPLSAGSSLVIPDPDGHKDPAYIGELMLKHKVTGTISVPSLAIEYIKEKSVQDAGQYMRSWIVGGEQLPLDLTKSMQTVFPNLVGPVNAYGPTEATIIASSYCCPRPTTRMFIGTPDDNMHAYVVDPVTFALMPVGVPGELWLSGPRLAIGYAGRLDLTAAAFVENPFYETIAPNLPLQLRSFYRRAYRTGDLVRWTYDGLLDYLGRIDRQVKVNGVRIELGEVDAALETAPGVARAAAAVLKDQSGRKALVGYVEATAEAAAGVRAHCRSVLVPAMVPSIIVPLPALPLLPNGKLDLKALPEPDWSLASASDEYVAPTDAVEEGVASIWAQSLGIEDPIGIYTDFYRLGGTSLKAIALAAALKSAFDLPGSTAPLLNMSTVAEMATYVHKSAPAESLILHAGGNVVLQPKGLAAHLWEDEYRPLSAGQVQMFMLQTTERCHPLPSEELGI